MTHPWSSVYNGVFSMQIVFLREKNGVLSDILSFVQQCFSIEKAIMQSCSDCFVKQDYTGDDLALSSTRRDFSCWNLQCFAVKRL